MSDQSHQPGAEHESVGRFLRFVWDERVRLVVTATVFGIVLLAVMLYRQTLTVPSAIGIVSLSFGGIEQHQYPNGRPFTPSEILSPEVLEGVIAELGLETRITVGELRRGVAIAPEVPGEIAEQWLLEDRRSVPRSTYHPNEYRVSLSLPDFSGDEHVSMVNAIVTNYRDRATRQLWARELVLSGDLAPSGLAGRLDYWEIPDRFERLIPPVRTAVKLLQGASRASASLPRPAPPGPLLIENLDHQKLVSFEALDAAIDVFRQEELTTLAGYTYEHRVVRNLPRQRQRLGFRRRQAVMSLATVQEEADRLRGIIADVERPQVLMQAPPGGLTSTEANPVVLGSLLEYDDYYADLVRGLTTTERAIAAHGGQVRAYDDEIEQLRTATSTDEPSAEYSALLAGTEARFQMLLASYERLTDEYAKGTLARHIAMREGPLIVPPDRLGRAGLVGLVALLSLFAAVLFVSLRHALRSAFLGGL